MTAAARIVVVPITTPPEAPIAMAFALHAFLVELITRGVSLDGAETALADGLAAQAHALREAGVR